MAIDNSLYDSLEQTYFKIKAYLEAVTLQAEHSPLIMKLDAFANLLESFDIEALEEQTKEIHALHDQLNAIKKISKRIVEDLGAGFDSITTAEKVASGLDSIFIEIKSIVL